MFGKKRRELEEKLRLEREAHKRDLRELKELRSRIDLKEETLDEMQSALEKKLQEMNEKQKQFQEERTRLDHELQAEIERKREALGEEIEKNRNYAEQQLNGKLEAFSSNYNYYLSQLKLIMDVLTKASVTAGKTFLRQDETDTAKLFQTIFNSELDEQAILLLPQQAKSEEAPEASAEHRQNTGTDADSEVSA